MKLEKLDRIMAEQIDAELQVVYDKGNQSACILYGTDSTCVSMHLDMSDMDMAERVFAAIAHMQYTIVKRACNDKVPPRDFIKKYTAVIEQLMMADRKKDKRRNAE